VNFRILGPLEVVGTDGPLTVAGRIRRSLLLRLLLQANRPVPDDALAFDLWAGAPTPGSHSTLASHVSLLRKSLGGDRILHRAGGYLVAVEPGELDAAEFEAAAAAGRTSMRRSEFAQAVGQLQTALALWRGRALADVDELDWARGEVARLDELRIEAGESLLTAQIVMGRIEGIVAAAEAAVRDHPLRERGWAILMTALYRSGRQTEALRAYQRLRNYLSDELGVDPSPALADLEEAMLLQRADLPWPDPQLGGSFPPITERRRRELVAVVAVSGDGDDTDDAPGAAEAIAAFGGRVTDTTSDGARIVFPSATSAIEASVSTQRHRAEHGRPPLALAISIGEVHGQGASLVGEAIEEAVGLAARSQPGDILVTQAVQILADPGGHFPFEAVHPPPSEIGDRHPPVLRLPWGAATGSQDPLPLVPALAPSGAPFVGRTGPLDALARLAGRADAGERQIVLVSGEPGIGKSALVGSFARQARASGASVLYGRCLEIGHPYQPFAEALGTFVQHARSEDLHRHVASFGGEAGRLVPALSKRVPGTPAPTVSDLETERFLAFQAAIGLLGEACRDRLVVLVLEDLHWSDTGSLALLHHLSVADHPSRLLVIGTFRSTDLVPDDPLVDVLASLWRERGVSRVDLEGLTLDEITDLCLAMTGGDQDVAAVASLSSRVERETAGNALFACELLRQRSETEDGGGGRGPTTASAGSEPTTVPTRLHEVIVHRIRRLGAKAERTLALAAVIGEEFAPDVLGSVADVEVDLLLDVLEAGERAAIIAGEGGIYRFRHALIRRTLYDDIRDSRRRQVHARVAATLEAGDESPSVLAHHYLAAGMDEAGLVHAERAGYAALESMAPAEAASWFVEVSRLLELLHPDDLRRRCDAVLQRGIAVRLSGGGDYREILLEAVAMAKEAGDGRRMATAALANTRGYYSVAGQRDKERIDALNDCLAVLGGSDPALRARLLATVGSESIFGTSLDDRRDMVRRAKQAAIQVDDARTRLDTYNLVAEMLRYPTELAERLRDTAVALDLATQLGDPAAQYWATGNRMRALVESGAVEEGERQFARMADISERLGQPVMQWMTLFTSAKWSLLRGETADGERMAEEALDLGTAIGQPDAFNYYATQLSHARWQQGRLVEIIDLIEQGERDNPGIPAYRGALARAYCQAGRPDEARSLLSAAAADGFGDLPEDLLWTYGMVTFAEAAILLEDIDAAAVLYDALAPFDDQVSYLGTTCEGPIAHYLGGLAVVLDERGLAERHLRTAADFARRAKSPFFACRTLIETARRDGRAAGTTIATESLQLAATLARQGGFTAEAARARAMLDAAG